MRERWRGMGEVCFSGMFEIELLKDTSAVELEQALGALRHNERYLSPAIAHTVINQALQTCLVKWHSSR